MSLISDLRSNVDSLLSLRDTLGVALKPVRLVNRVWSGSEIGAGTCTETTVQVLPSPKVVEFTEDLRIVPGGAIEHKDILLKNISRQSYPDRSVIDGSSNSENIENLYDVGGVVCRVVSVTEKHLTWNVLLRPLSDQTRY